MSTNPYIYGLHDPGGEHLLSGRGWVVFTEGIGCDPNDRRGGDYRQWADQGLGVVVRLNHGYGQGTGTIPTPDRYRDFAQRCANFAANSQGIGWVVIGNEIALAWEWPTAAPIALADYLACYCLCYDAIKAVAPDVRIAPAAVAPWNDSTPDARDWVDQLCTMLTTLAARVDWICLHAYTRGYASDSFATGARMNAPYAHRYSGWETLYEFMRVIPDALRTLPIIITEANGNGPWCDYQRGWVQALYAAIERWNADASHQQIWAACLFRWAPHDAQWDMSTQGAVHDDLRAAVALGYRWRPPAPPLERTAYVTATNGLNLRSGSGTIYPSLLVIPYGVEIKLLGTIIDGWVGARVGDLYGYVAAAYTAPEPPASRQAQGADVPAVELVETLAADYGVDPLLVRAVIQIESGGRAFLNNRLIIRFEPHIFFGYLQGSDLDEGRKRFQVGHPKWDGAQHRLWRGDGWLPFHGNQDLEYVALNLARELNPDWALLSTSMGSPQIMGFHWRALGYASAQAMFYAFANSEAEQLRAMFRFMEAQGAIRCLQAGDLLGFARIYNGTAQAGRYAALIEQTWKGLNHDSI